jgi:hypothetical protein
MQHIEEMKEKVMKYWDAANEDWENKKLPSDEMENLSGMFRNLFST